MNQLKTSRLRSIRATARRAEESPPVRGFDQQELCRIGTFSLRQAAGRLRSLALLSASPRLRQELLGLSAQLERQAMELGALPASSQRKVASHG